MGWLSKENEIEKIEFQPEVDSPIRIELRGVDVDKENSDYLQIQVKVENTTDMEIDAFMIGFEFFTVFNEYRGHMRGYSLEDIRPEKSMKMDWKFLILEAPITGSVVAFPYKVRFKNGSIWSIEAAEVEAYVFNMFKVEIDLESEEGKALY